MSVTKALQQFPKDLQAVLQGATSAGVYQGEAPRDASGVVRAVHPFAVYTCFMRSPDDEEGSFTADLIVDVWALDRWAAAYEVAGEIHDAIDGANALLASGSVTIDANGATLAPQAPDPENERVRRLRSQYVVVLHPRIDY